ncbi:porin [uncultured Paraglaciecola sp.]|uniref:OprO/OprP family phosphate-selective porin n=1 Tax=uncultured Paraglaciecola sp. TaxID=1765024 RepID=UPI0030D7276C|tara:strand:+ start:65126 stop:66214 length:1089 start_codon:yes stop_codon:yes gene_type:complete
MRLNTSPLLCALIGFTSLAAMSNATSNDYPSFSYSGNVRLNYDQFDGLFLEASEEADDIFEVNRVRLSLRSDLSSDWSAKLKFDVQDGFELKDAYLKYTAWDWANITIGKQKEPFGLEKLMSSKNLSFIERSMMSGAISPSRTYGVNLSGTQDSVNWQLGYFQDDNAEKGNAVTGRLTWAPWYINRNLIHLGAAYSQRSLHGESYRINETLEVNGSDSLIEGDKISADSMTQSGIEFMWQYNGLVNMAEWQQSNVSAVDGSEYSYEGGYYQVSYLFSGKNRKYKNGMLGNVKTQNDWEVSLRYSQLKLHQENSQAKVLSLGVNYLFDNDLKFMANFRNADYLDEGIDLGSGNALSLRVIYQF